MEKHRNTQSRGWSCCLKVTSQLHWVHAWLPGSLHPQEQWVRFPPQTSFPLSPHSFKAHIYSFKQHLFVFQESDTGRPPHSAVPGRSGIKSDTWQWTRTSLNPTFSPEENRGPSKPINQLSLFWGYSVVGELINGNDCNQTLNCHLAHLAPAVQAGGALLLWKN